MDVDAVHDLSPGHHDANYELLFPGEAVSAWLVVKVLFFDVAEA